MRKAMVLILMMMMTAAGVLAAPKDDWLKNWRTKRAAMDMFRAGSTAAAIAHLRQNSLPEVGAGGDTLGVVQNLIDIAVLFYNRREMTLARDVATQAALDAEPIVSGATPVTAVRRAELCSSLGTLHESVLFNPSTAQRYYETARALDPNDKINRRRAQLLVEKQKALKGGGR